MHESRPVSAPPVGWWMVNATWSQAGPERMEVREQATSDEDDGGGLSACARRQRAAVEPARGAAIGDLHAKPGTRFAANALATLAWHDHALSDAQSGTTCRDSAPSFSSSTLHVASKPLRVVGTAWSGAGRTTVRTRTDKHLVRLTAAPPHASTQIVNPHLPSGEKGVQTSPLAFRAPV